jgi:Rrf2 family iron-sulfur cluster assembly transcriptional regulator
VLDGCATVAYYRHVTSQPVPTMPLVSRKGILAIAAVIDVAVNARHRPVSAKALAARHNLPPRHLEPVLQALVHDGILRGIRGPHGGYELARNHSEITAEDILRAARAAEDAEAESDLPCSRLVKEVVRNALVDAERTFSAALSQISVADLMQQAEALT